MHHIVDDLSSRFAALFKGNPRLYGVYNRNTKKQEIIRSGLIFDDFKKHIIGEKSISEVPILDDGTCYFGVIDIDAHGDSADIDLLKIYNKVKKLDLPLIVCRSKSGGAHLYLFGMEPLNAGFVRKVLMVWAGQLGYAGSEVFPKQNKLNYDNSEMIMQDGNVINLPYFNGMSDNCNRYAVVEGERVSLEYFLNIADSNKITSHRLLSLSQLDHKEAPPCIQAMYKNGVSIGYRNNATYNAAIYIKKAFPDEYQERLIEFNTKVVEEPLSFQELTKISKSVSRRDYKYKCSEEPLCSNCNSTLCVRREFGIEPEDKSLMDSARMPRFDKLIRYTNTPSDPWGLVVDGKEIKFSIEDIYRYNKIRMRVTAELGYMPPRMKDDRWEVILSKLLIDRIDKEIPVEASVDGMIEQLLFEYLNKCDISKTGKIGMEERLAIKQGEPTIYDITVKGITKRVVLFKYSAFIEFLRDKKFDLNSNKEIWEKLRKIGCFKHTFSYKKYHANIRCWAISVERVHNLSYRTEIDDLGDADGDGEFEEIEDVDVDGDFDVDTDIDNIMKPEF